MRPAERCRRTSTAVVSVHANPLPVYAVHADVYGMSSIVLNMIDDKECDGLTKEPLADVDAGRVVDHSPCKRGRKTPMRILSCETPPDAETLNSTDAQPESLLAGQVGKSIYGAAGQGAGHYFYSQPIFRA